MFELLRRLIRWILFAIVVFLLIFLIIKLVNRNKTSINKLKNGESVVDTIKIKDDSSKTGETVTVDNNSNDKNSSSSNTTTDNNTTTNNNTTTSNTTKTNNTTTTNNSTTTSNNSTTSTVVDTPNTATKDDFLILFGLSVVGSGIYYIYTKRNLIEIN